jgi:hypothetical protein
MHRLIPTLCPLALFFLASPEVVEAKKPPPPAELRLLLKEDFAKGADRWEPTDANAWKVVEGDKGKYYSQFQQSKYKPPHRSPFNVSLLKGIKVDDFTLEAKVLSTGKENPHRDMCLFFGYQDPAHFYYVHLAKRADDYANQIFIVNGADRKKISTKTSPGTPWDDKWHDIKIVRRVATGTIEVYFDDMRTPVMTAKDTTFTWGQVGLGSFDDSGHWRDVTLRGNQIEKK